MSNTAVKPSDLLLKKFKHEPTDGQLQLFGLMDKFLMESEEDDRSVFVLKGYAGTGKTTFLSTLIKVLPKFGWKSVLLAPTGRAAKVMSNYSKRSSQTIHKKIYKQTENSYSGNFAFERQKNFHSGTLFIVDEASMISDQREFGKESLLKDLFTYVFEGEDNKLMLIGDEAQLPPVGMNLSPALDAEHVANQFYAEVMSHELSDVTRQVQDSGILSNATLVRQALQMEKPSVCFQTKGFKDIYRMNSERIEDGLKYAYDKYGQENTIVITRSNKNAVQYNQYIRNRIHYLEHELEIGDLLMVVRNNYSVLTEDAEASFVANGEFVEVRHIGREEEMHGFRFQHVALQMVDYPNDPEFDTLIILDTLNSHAPNLGREESKALYESVLKDYYWVKSKRERSELLAKDQYLNALQVKYANALTCHKSQGGQWDAVFIDQGYIPNQEIDHDYVRWLYTAVTRGVKEVFLVNFNPKFFTES
ncbi:AAA family ATPase [Marinilongibacter aquaticus]|uniref:ATP-dependent DNA helicase n=1 Tax=Marinilongibacter aquaticus TaxID=2975157 RepID=UPI0021BD74D6|nr:AAA family ATPase [Marinilongibacter aquaticus]UBM59008.1 AAA family ATPase [Marinilongibacter aquaticus]